MERLAPDELWALFRPGCSSAGRCTLPCSGPDTEKVREGADLSTGGTPGTGVAVLTGKLLDGWLKRMRLIVRKERPHPGDQLRITNADGMRITRFATSTPDRPIAELELRHRLRARAGDRIRAARATGLRNLLLHTTAQNKVWLEITQIALGLLAWMPMLALTGTARLWEPGREMPLVYLSW